MAFDEVLFPTNISRNARVSVFDPHSGIRYRSGAPGSIARWPRALWQFDVAFGLRGARDFTDIDAVVEFFVCRRGPSRGFRFQNPYDFSTASDNRGTPAQTDEILGTGDASQTIFQLQKTYTSGGQTETRTISKPKAGTVVVEVNGVLQTETTHYTVDTSSGEILFVTAPPLNHVVKAGCKFDLPCHFDHSNDRLDLTLVSTGGEAGQVPSILIAEMAGDVVTPELFPRGGASVQSFSSDLIFDWNMGAMVVLTPSTSGLAFVLPTISGLDDGGPHLHLINEGSDAVSIVNRTSGSEEFSLAASTAAQLGVVTVSGSKTWKALKGT